jgi:putative SOS response-associated peptidase YedK
VDARVVIALIGGATAIIAAEPAQLKAMLAPYPAEGMTMWPVSTRVGSVKNNDPSLIEPVAFV